MAYNPSCSDSLEAGPSAKELPARCTEAAPHYQAAGLRLSLRSGPALPQTMPASEQMFFFGAPFAHVVQYEEELRAGRHEKNLRQLTRLHTAPRRRV